MNDTLSSLEAAPGSDGAKVEEWAGVPSMSGRSFPSGIHGAEKANSELDVKHPQQVDELEEKITSMLKSRNQWWDLHK